MWNCEVTVPLVMPLVLRPIPYTVRIISICSVQYQMNVIWSPRMVWLFRANDAPHYIDTFTVRSCVFIHEEVDFLPSSASVAVVLVQEYLNLPRRQSPTKILCLLENGTSLFIMANYHDGCRWEKDMSVALVSALRAYCPLISGYMRRSHGVHGLPSAVWNL